MMRVSDRTAFVHQRGETASFGRGSNWTAFAHKQGETASLVHSHMQSRDQRERPVPRCANARPANGSPPAFTRHEVAP